MQQGKIIPVTCQTHNSQIY